MVWDGLVEVDLLVLRMNEAAQGILVIPRLILDIWAEQWCLCVAQANGRLPAVVLAHDRFVLGFAAAINHVFVCLSGVRRAFDEFAPQTNWHTLQGRHPGPRARRCATDRVVEVADACGASMVIASCYSFLCFRFCST